jgi:hypothetical protein
MKMKNILKKDYLTVAIVGLSLLGLSGCSKDPALNHKPVVTVPNDKIVTLNEPLTLTAKVFDKDEEDVLTYLWRISAKPKDSNLTLKDATKKTISFKADKSGTYYLDFVANDEFANSEPKRVTVVVSSILGEWTADLTKTKEENKLNDDEKIEVAEILSSNYKLTFLEDGKVEGKESASWKHVNNGNYKLDDRELKLIDANHLFVMSKLKDRDLKFYYKRVLKK